MCLSATLQTNDQIHRCPVSPTERWSSVSNLNAPSIKERKKREPCCFLDNAPVAGPWRLAFRPQAPYKSRLRCRMVGLRFAMMRGQITWRRHPPCLCPSRPAARPPASCPQGPAEDVQNRKVRLIHPSSPLGGHQPLDDSHLPTLKNSEKISDISTSFHLSSLRKSGLLNSSGLSYHHVLSSPFVSTAEAVSGSPPVLIVKGQSYFNGFDLHSTVKRLYFHQYH